MNHDDIASIQLDWMEIENELEEQRERISNAIDEIEASLLRSVGFSEPIIKTLVRQSRFVRMVRYKISRFKYAISDIAFFLDVRNLL